MTSLPKGWTATKAWISTHHEFWGDLSHMQARVLGLLYDAEVLSSRERARFASLCREGVPQVKMIAAHFNISSDKVEEIRREALHRLLELSEQKVNSRQLPKDLALRIAEAFADDVDVLGLVQRNELAALKLKLSNGGERPPKYCLTPEEVVGLTEGKEAATAAAAAQVIRRRKAAEAFRAWFDST